MPVKLNKKQVIAGVAALALVGAYGFSQQPTTKTITLVEGENTRTIETTADTVLELLNGEGIRLTLLDRCSVKPATSLTDGMTVTLTRVREERVTERTTVPFTTRKRFTDSLREGQKKVVTPGKNGETITTYKVMYKDNVQTLRAKVSETKTQPQTEVLLVGASRKVLASRSMPSLEGRRTMILTATAYSPIGNGKWGMQTATPGVRCRYGIVAVDPRVIPLGTRLYVEGYGECVALDTGGAIKGRRIDLFYPTERQASNYGRRKVRVTILGR
jgi:3D (Asp-Asp-Asp) domain-containing protein